MSFSQEDQAKYKALYLQTAREYIKELKDNLMQLSSGHQTPDVIDTLHRGAHSLKGQSQMMGFASMSGVSKLMEDIFFAKKETKLVLTDAIVKKLTEAVDAMELCVEEIDKNNKENDLSQMEQDLASLAKIPA